jgi:hypothetical protein
LLFVRSRRSGRQNNFITAHTVACGMPGRGLLNNAIGYAEHRSRSHRAVIRMFDEAGNVIETHEHGRFKEWQ